MFNDGCGYSLADIAAATGNDNRNNNGYGFGGEWLIWVVLIFALMGGWGGFGGFGGFGGGAGLNGALTRGELCQDMNFQSLENATRGIQQGLCDGFYSQNTTMLQGFNGIQNSLCQGFNGVNSAIANLGYQNQQCCCETNRNIDNVRFENAKNTCDIVNAIREDGALTRAQLTQNEIQSLRDQLQTANFQLSQQAQSANLINQLRPCPIPAYLSCSPYTTYEPYGRGYNGYNDCGCNNSRCC